LTIIATLSTEDDVLNVWQNTILSACSAVFPNAVVVKHDQLSQQAYVP